MSSSSQHIGFIGGGAMATAIARGIVNAKLVPPEQIHVSDLSLDTLRPLASLNMRTTTDNSAVASSSNVLFLCTKPDSVLSALRGVASSLKHDTLIVSIAAGVTLDALEGCVPTGTRVVRVMPNTPSLVGAGASAYALGSACKPADASIVEQLLGSIGTALRVAEKDLNAVTGLSASGPAYVFLFLEALADGGVRAGLTRSVAQQLAIQTVLGSAKLCQVTGKHPAVLKDQVASPGGTTIAGIHALEDGAFRATVMDAVLAATVRAKEMGEASAAIKSKL